MNGASTGESARNPPAQALIACTRARRCLRGATPDLAQELGRKLGVMLPTCSAASEMLSAARSSELADRDFLVSVADVYRRAAGVEVR